MLRILNLRVYHSFNVSLERGRFALLSVPVFVYKSSEQTQPARHQREASAPPPRTPLPNAHTPSFIAFMTGRRTKRQAEEESRLKLSTFLRTTTFSASDCLRFLMLPRILPHGMYVHEAILLYIKLVLYFSR